MGEAIFGLLFIMVLSLMLAITEAHEGRINRSRERQHMLAIKRDSRKSRDFVEEMEYRASLRQH